MDEESRNLSIKATFGRKKHLINEFYDMESEGNYVQPFLVLQ
jgi:hypothetical protein